MLAQTAPSAQPDVPVELSMSGPRRTFTTRPKAAILSYPIRTITAGEGNGGGRVGIIVRIAAPSADMTERLDRARIDAFDVDMTACREWVRATFREYNAELARHFQEARAG